MRMGGGRGFRYVWVCGGMRMGRKRLQVCLCVCGGTEDGREGFHLRAAGRYV